MLHGYILGTLHQFVEWLLYPVVLALGLTILLTLWELGQLLAERWVTLSRYH